jgi:hypothetical protein
MGEVLGVAGLALGSASLAIQIFDGAVKGKSFAYVIKRLG